MIEITNLEGVLSRDDMKNIMAGGEGGLGGCYIQCCTGGPGSCYGGSQTVEVSDSFEQCTSNEQCQSDYISNIGSDPCAESGGYAAALCYN